MDKNSKDKKRFSKSYKEDYRENNRKIPIAFAIENGDSKRIAESQVSTRLNLDILTEALQRSRNNNHTEVGRWLMQQFQKEEN